MAAQVRRTHNHGWGCGPLTASLGSHSILTLTYLNFYNFWKRRKEKWLQVPEYCCTLMSKLDSSIARVCRSSSRPLQKAFWWKFACKHSVGLLAAAAQSPRLWQKLGTHSFLEFLPTAAAEAGPGWPLVAVVRCWRRPRAFLYTDHYIFILHCLYYSSSTLNDIFIAYITVCCMFERVLSILLRKYYYWIHAGKH